MNNIIKPYIHNVPQKREVLWIDSHNPVENLTCVCRCCKKPKRNKPESTKCY